MAATPKTVDVDYKINIDVTDPIAQRLLAVQSTAPLLQSTKSEGGFAKSPIGEPGSVLDIIDLAHYVVTGQRPGDAEAVMETVVNGEGGAVIIGGIPGNEYTEDKARRLIETTIEAYHPGAVRTGLEYLLRQFNEHWEQVQPEPQPVEIVEGHLDEAAIRRDQIKITEEWMLLQIKRWRDANAQAGSESWLVIDLMYDELATRARESREVDHG